MKYITLVVAIVILLNGCTGFFFQPMKSHLRHPSDLGLVVKDIWLMTPDGNNIHGWFLPAEGTPKATIIFSHGNAENISTHIGSVYTMPKHGVNVFLFDYRGYGKSSGEPTVTGLITDFKSALAYAVADEEMSAVPIFVLGQSLGGAISICGLTRTADINKVSGVIIESTFTTFPQITQDKLSSFWLTWLIQWPVAMTIDDTCRPVDDIPKLSPIPVLILHSEHDRVIPIEHGEGLFQAAKEPKEFWRTRFHRHNGIFADIRNQKILAEYIIRIAEKN